MGRLAVLLVTSFMATTVFAANSFQRADGVEVKVRADQEAGEHEVTIMADKELSYLFSSVTKTSAPSGEAFLSELTSSQKVIIAEAKLFLRKISQTLQRSGRLQTDLEGALQAMRSMSKGMGKPMIRPVREALQGGLKIANQHILDQNIRIIQATSFTDGYLYHRQTEVGGLEVTIAGTPLKFYSDLDPSGQVRLSLAYKVWTNHYHAQSGLYFDTIKIRLIELDGEAQVKTFVDGHPQCLPESYVSIGLGDDFLTEAIKASGCQGRHFPGVDSLMRAPAGGMSLPENVEP